MAFVSAECAGCRRGWFGVDMFGMGGVYCEDSFRVKDLQRTIKLGVRHYSGFVGIVVVLWVVYLFKVKGVPEDDAG